MAEKMFYELGFTCLAKTEEGACYKKDCIYFEEEGTIYIDFETWRTEIRIAFITKNDEYKPIIIDSKLLQAINKQTEEYGQKII